MLRLILYGPQTVVIEQGDLLILPFESTVSILKITESFNERDTLCQVLNQLKVTFG